MKVGEEAEVYLPAYHRRGGAYSNLRQMLRRAQHNKLTVTIDKRLSDEFKYLESFWLDERAQRQRMQLLVGEQNTCTEAIFAVVEMPEINRSPGRRAPWFCS